ncbi:hypothetical protein B0O80DRAFT_498472 [Mortierella sp. GBAus27b]|nr:hypothetical protein BGX31_010295 [Mortierella sp. GBA43]KAI8354465.1 hypothetical protein B0O80DRAFT_498472 [Mortierella sp. GBAus27b]
MSPLANGTVEELAQKYQDKALARKRGAGTHQPKFRGFTLGRKSEGVRAEDDEQSATVPGLNTTLLFQDNRSTELPTTVPEVTHDTPPRVVDTSSTGLNEKYQERLKNRFRGAGAHQPDFRGFTLKSRNGSGEYGLQQSSKANDSSTSLSVAPSSTQLKTTKERSNGKLDLLGTKRIPASDTRDSSSTEKRPLPIAFRALSIGQDRNRSVSRDVERPRLVLTSGRKSSTAIQRVRDKTVSIVNHQTAPSRSSQQPDVGREQLTKPPTEHRAPSIEDTVDHEGEFNDFDTLDQIPSPTHDITDTVPEPIPVASKRRRSVSPSLAESSTIATRKSTATPMKRRRLIQEETDENEDPLPLDTNQATDAGEGGTTGTAKTTVNLSKSGQPDKSTNVDSTKTKTSKDGSRVGSRPAPTTKESMPAVRTTRETGRSLRQATLMHLSKPTRKESGPAELQSKNSNVVISSDVDDDSDFEKHLAQMTKEDKNVKSTKTSTKSSGKKRKGPSERTVKGYKQLQIHCLKFWGPFSAVSRPATVRNKETAKQLPVEGEDTASSDPGPSQKVVQSVLQFEDAPLSEMDVVAEAVRGVVDSFIVSLEDQAMEREMIILRSELETALIEQVDMLDDHTLLRASAKKATAVKKELRVRLLAAQRQRQKTREELKRVRASFEREERARRRLEETHNFLTDLEALRDHVTGSDDEDEEDEKANDRDGESPKTGLQSLIATVGSRCAKPIGGQQDNTSSGILGALREFNQLLEETEKNLRKMPLITHSQELTSLKRIVDFDDDDFDDFDFT